MTLKEIIERCGGLNICEKRNITDNYCELVFFRAEKDELNKVFEGIFGPPVKPTGEKPTREALRLAKDYGGLRDSQKLYKKEFDGDTFIAMFWPWHDGVHVTVKLAILPKKER